MKYFLSHTPNYSLLWQWNITLLARYWVVLRTSPIHTQSLLTPNRYSSHLLNYSRNPPQHQSQLWLKNYFKASHPWPWTGALDLCGNKILNSQNLPPFTPPPHGSTQPIAAYLCNNKNKTLLQNELYKLMLSNVKYRIST